MESTETPSADMEPQPPPPPPPPLLRFPSEILAAICSHLPNRDIKALRLAAGPALCHAVPPRFARVFLSPDPTNLAVFRAVAAHPTFRLAVREIVLHGRHANDHDAGGEGGSAARRAARDAQRDAQPPLESSYQHYLALLRAQGRAVAEGADERALAEGLDAFPALERITVTPATHGYLYTPLYRTPMIRALPLGFNYPIPRGWPTSSRQEEARSAPTPAPPVLHPWVTADAWTEEDVAREKARWRGLMLTIRTLAERIRSGRGVPVPELVVDVHSLRTGVSPYMLAQDCDEHRDLALVLRQPGFRRLDLPVLVAGTRPEDAALLDDGRLKRLLAEARHLQHFRLRVDGEAETPAGAGGGGAGGGAGGGQRRRFIPLQSLLPLDAWPALRHLGLSGVRVRVADLVGALGALPPTLRSVELSFLVFPSAEEDGGLRRDNHAALLDAMKARLTSWAARPRGQRPSVTVGLAKAAGNVDGRGLWCAAEIGAFLYGDGPNPFGWHRDVLLPGVGWLADEYDEDFARPYLAYKDYRALWYSEEG
ncbi:Cyclin-like F-box [Cordyceps javanica]|uniref:Cyclin-like F-box n=1 Tax=Cordyceps javanica TaxID=43265 RepID=A0A545UUT6_9HYPO|nr:Cyclin-like F-box [Cordyceps javanica]